MRVTGWTRVGNPDYTEINGTWAIGDCPYDREELRPLIVKELRDRGYKFSGFYHQDGDYGAPIIDDKYTVLYSYRGWGDIIAEAYQLDDSDGMAYCVWAWNNPEEQVTPDPSDYE